MTDSQIVDFLQQHADFFTTNNIVITVLRTIGWMLVKGACILIDACKELYDITFGLVDITRWSGLEAFLDEFEPLIMAFLFLSIVVLGFLYMFGKNKKHNVFTSILIFAVVVTSSNYLFGQLNLWSVTFKDAVTSGDNASDGPALVKSYLFDLVYMDGQMGLKDLTRGDASQYASLSQADLDYIDITEVVDYNRDGLSEDARSILKKRLLFKNAGENALLDVKDGVAWTDFGNTFYYRYTFYYWTFYLSALAVLIIYICLSYKNVRIIYEIFVSRILITLKSAEMSGSKKTIMVLESIRDGYYALCFTAITLRTYFLFGDYLAQQTDMSSIVRAIILLFVAFCVVDGANVMQKITGVDAGLSSMAGKLIAGYHLVRGGMQTVQQARQFHMMKQQSEAMKQMKESAVSQSEAGNGSDNRAENFQDMEQSMEEHGGAEEQNHYEGQKQDMDGSEGNANTDTMASPEGTADAEGMDGVDSETMNTMNTMDSVDGHAGQFEEKSMMGAGENTQMDAADWQAKEGDDAGQNGKGQFQDTDSLSKRMAGYRENPEKQPSRKMDNTDSPDWKRNAADRGRFEPDEDKNMFERWGARFHHGSHDSMMQGKQSDVGQPEGTGKRAARPEPFPVKEQKKESGVRHITQEKRGKDKYVGGDAGGEGKWKK